MSETYTIRPLEWKSGGNALFQWFRADTPFGWYVVERGKDFQSGSWSGWEWRQCFGDRPARRAVCASDDAGKAAAEAHWLNLLAGALEPAKEPA